MKPDPPLGGSQRPKDIQLQNCRYIPLLILTNWMKNLNLLIKRQEQIKVSRKVSNYAYQIISLPLPTFILGLESKCLAPI